LAWGEFTLVEPIDSLPDGVGADLVGQMQPQAGAHFGAWIVHGRYNPLGFPRDQFVISARERTLPAGPEVGQVYSFHLLAPGP
jgi:hypothetical protein